VDTVDKVPADTKDSVVDATMDADEVDDGVEDEVHLRRRRSTTTYHKSVDKSPHSSVEERDYSMPRIPSNATIIGIIVSHVGSMLKMGIHPQHAHRIGENLDIRRDVTGRMCNNTLRLDTLHPSKDSIRISCQRGSDR
jgi:hypothetical protein